MRGLLIFAACSFLSSSRAPGQSPPAMAVPQLVATGTGEASVSPDRATVFIGVQTRAASVATAAADNARRQRAILDTLRAVGMNGNQLSTVNYSVSPEMQYLPNQPPKVTGYIVSNNVRVDVNRLDDIGRVIDASLAKGANEITSLQFSSTKTDSVRRVAIASAVAVARANAEAMARAAGGSLGPLIELTTGEIPTIRRDVFMGKAMAASVPTPIEPGQQTLTATVTGRWAFSPTR